MAEPFDPITLEILWSRLNSTVDEAAVALIRTSFSTVVRESHDFACILLDSEGNSLAQSSISVPSFLGTLPITVKHFLKIYGKEGLEPGDVLITNDPWIGSGHLPDISMARPIFYQDKLIGFSGTIAHSPDIGGKTRAADAREIYEEGLYIPPLKIAKRDTLNEDLISIIRKNVRVPDQVMGDIFAQMSASRLMSKRMIELIEEYRLGDLGALARTIQGHSEKAARKAISQLRAGEYTYELQTDGFEELLTIKIRLIIKDGEIEVDYSGSSPQIDRAFNTPPNYTYAYTAYPIKCAIYPEIPSNEGCFRPIRVFAPEGSILNPLYPAAVNGRVLVGHVLPAAVYGALCEAVPDKIAAASGAPIWSMTVRGEWNGDRFTILFFLNCGQGGMQGRDGSHCESWPSNISNTPVEVVEGNAPIVFVKKSLAADSGGAGEFQGGCGQEIEILVLSETPLHVSFFADRTKVPAFGLLGGHQGMRGKVLINGKEVNSKEPMTVKRGDRVSVCIPGGGGFGNPSKRSIERIHDDLQNGVITWEFARREYGVNHEGRR